MGEVTSLEAEYSKLAVWVGFKIPKPPSLQGEQISQLVVRGVSSAEGRKEFCADDVFQRLEKMANVFYCPCEVRPFAHQSMCEARMSGLRMGLSNGGEL